MTDLNADLHMDTFDDLEVAMHVDQGLASLNVRFEDHAELRATYPTLDDFDIEELSSAIATACDAWDRVADLLPGFREA